MKHFKHLNVEAVVWLSGLVLLACMNPSDDSHLSLCPLKNLGMAWCPGCGLGHSISYFFHGNILMSLKCHVLGIPTVFILTARSFSLLRKSFGQLTTSTEKTGEE
jgi:hypothetical protein